MKSYFELPINMLCKLRMRQGRTVLKSYQHDRVKYHFHCNSNRTNDVINNAQIYNLIQISNKTVA